VDDEISAMLDFRDMAKPVPQHSEIIEQGLQEACSIERLALACSK